MSLFLVAGAAALIAFFATRAAQKSARATEARLLATYRSARVRRPTAAEAPGFGTDDAAESAFHEATAGDYARAAITSLEDELRTVRGERAPSLYSPDQARHAKRLLAPAFGITMRVKA